MTEPPDDQTHPLPPAPEPADVPAWTSAAGDRTPSTDPGPPGSSADAPAGTDPASAAAVDGAVPSGPRWSGRRTAVVVAAALGIGTLGAVGAAVAVGGSDSVVRSEGRGDGGAPGGGRDQLPGDGRGRSPDGDEAPGGSGPGGRPGGVPPGGVDHDGDGDRPARGDRDGGPEAVLPGPDGGTGSTDPGDANGVDTALDA